MKSSFIWAVLLVLSCAGVGCSRMHPKAAPPPQAQAPDAVTENTPPPAPTPITPPVLPPAPEVAVTLGTPPSANSRKTRSDKNHVKQNRHIVTDNPGAKSAPGTQAAGDQAAGQSAADASSPIGQLSAGDSTDNPALRQGIVSLIASTEKRLKTVDSSIAATRHGTIAQIQLFLKQANQALAINDLQGANTLATKARILVDELLK